MALRVKITRKGIPLTQVIKNFRTKVELTKTQVKALGLQTQDHMRGIIKQNSKKSTGKLAAAVDVEYFADGVSWGVGNIAEMDSKVKYWKNVNYGHQGYTIRAKNTKYLQFKDKQGNIIYRKEIHNHAVKPMNFVERTAWWFKRQVLTIGKRLGSR